MRCKRMIIVAKTPEVIGWMYSTLFVPESFVSGGIKKAPQMNVVLIKGQGADLIDFASDCPVAIGKIAWDKTLHIYDRCRGYVITC